ncbi:hypothetical protein RRG08_049804 [Elysia crispata]|uniref:DDE Tnp4 domain-containing protein n=1 Tax=Elysia crispata TaxID=231223 RepID=A0AAE0ZRN5_9GAST|nr:hypothetical protein RRG08_049804 [Elysia crispata]
MADFPNVIGCIDGTHVPIRAPNINEHEYVNRKNVHTINVQKVCDAQLRILNSVVKYTDKVCKIITSCLVLHNVALEFGIPIEAVNDNIHQPQQEADPGLEEERELGQITGRIKGQLLVRRYFTLSRGKLAPTLWPLSLTS